ncbi:TRAM domain-containing protein (plasmid) [Haloplanus rubicundus]|uniref:TRAM domain-containing protein n=1 Tax=Haloplanus rubicundus TaxID=1547898 RepID=A0A345E824_9EURY|nr:TRAM domain-containing protein [Haloplanus rubicundus]AXG08346.1 TRAM domain-containing protein [Haloplanus rubicundus]
MDLPIPLCLCTAHVEDRGGEYVVTIPKQEVELGTLDAGETYRVGLYPGPATASGTTPAEPPKTAAHKPDVEQSTHSASDSETLEPTDPSVSPQERPDQPPVTEGEERRLQIEDVGDKGDGIARVGPGYVVFVSDTEIGQQPLVRITTVRENFAFAEVLKQ